MRIFPSTDEGQCPFDCNFTFAFFEDHVTKKLEQVPNAYFPEIQGIISLKDVTNGLKEIRAGRVSMCRCIKMKDGSTQEFQISLRHQLASSTSWSPECVKSPFRKNRRNTYAASSPLVVQDSSQQEAAVTISPSTPCLPSLAVRSLLCTTPKVPAGQGDGEALSEQPTPSPCFERSSPSHGTSNLLAHIGAYEKACYVEYGSDSLDAEGAPIYTVMQKGKKRKSLHAVHNHTLSSGDAATAVFHMINLAAIKNGS